MAFNPTRDGHMEDERGDEPLRAKPVEGWEWWPQWYEARLERNRLERARWAAIERIIRKGIHDPF